MREKYVEESFPRYMIFGEYPDGDYVDVASSGGDVVTHVKRSEAFKLIDDRNAIVDRLVKIAIAFDESAPEAFDAAWYGNVKGEPMPNHPDAYYAGYRAALDNDHAMTTKTVPDPIPNNPFEPDTPNHRQFCNGYADAVRG